jgi:uncharacterized membrane protein YhhN
MKISVWLILFFAALGVNLAGIVLQNEQLQNFSKPELIPFLAGYFLDQTNGIAGSIKKNILAALFFSWAGDVLLMFVPKDEIFFLLGVSAFLIAHIFYIAFFHHVRIKEKVKGNPWLMVIVVVYYGTLIAFLSPHLANMKWPVRVYGIVISFMFMLAMHMLGIKNKTAGKWMMMGALLFVISDSVLAINKFYQSFELADIVIILTYVLAQLFIVQGAVKYIRND